MKIDWMFTGVMVGREAFWSSCWIVFGLEYALTSGSRPMESPGKYTDGFENQPLTLHWTIATEYTDILHIQIGRYSEAAPETGDWESLAIVTVASVAPDKDEEELQVLRDWSERGYRARYEQGVVVVMISSLTIRDTGTLSLHVSQVNGYHVMGSTYINVMKRLPAWEFPPAGGIQGHVGDLIPIRLHRKMDIDGRTPSTITVDFRPMGTHIWQELATVTRVSHNRGIKTEYNIPSHKVQYVGDPEFQYVVFMIRHLAPDHCGEYRVTVHYDRQVAVLEHTLKIDVTGPRVEHRHPELSNESHQSLLINKNFVLYTCIISALSLMIISFSIVVGVMIYKKKYKQNQMSSEDKHHLVMAEEQSKGLSV